MRLVRANPLTWADSAGWTAWEVLNVLDVWKMALVTVLVEVERVKMLWCVHLLIRKHTGNSCERDWMIQKCCADSPVVKVQLKMG